MAASKKACNKLRLGFVLGTRPEVIKLAPVIREARHQGHETLVVLTGQHRQMTAELMSFFEISADFDLDVMVESQSLTGLSQRVLAGLERLDPELRSRGACDAWIVQGDTTSAWTAAYWAFCRGDKVAHVEAGLRTYNLYAPFPEEANRQLIGRVATFHFSPTQAALRNLKQEHVSGHAIKVGNTGIDALLWARSKQNKLELPLGIADFLGSSQSILVTAHRRESFGQGVQEICKGILDALKVHSAIKIIFPVHPNPNIKNIVSGILGSHERILLCEPLSYPVFVALMDHASVILTDSGGIQEEAPSLRKPILVMRDETERPEGVKAGYSKMVGADRWRISTGISEALRDGCTGRGTNPYGDGRASGRIISALANGLKPSRSEDSATE